MTKTQTQTVARQPLTKADLAQFTGYGDWHSHRLVEGVFYSEGARYVAENADAYWLLDEIAFAQVHEDVADWLDPSQIWKLKVLPERTVLLSCFNWRDKLVFEKRIYSVDFPLPEFTLSFIDSEIMLPSEY